MFARLALVAAAVGCSTKDKPEPPPAPPPPVVHDAGVDGITTIGEYDPASGRHLDDDGASRVPAHPAQARPGRPIDVTLRSSPTGARAAVDGVPIGNTPTYWAGEANGREHEFTFVLSGYAVARYRFVPVASGIIHARLDAVHEEVDAGTPFEVAPPGTAPPPPPPTMITPDASAPKLPIAPDAAAAPDATASPATDTGLGPPP